VTSRRRLLPDPTWAGSVALASAPRADRTRDTAGEGQALGPSGGAEEAGVGGSESGSGKELSQLRRGKVHGSASSLRWRRNILQGVYGC
jgi:hypothetical protein